LRRRRLIDNAIVTKLSYLPSGRAWSDFKRFIFDRVIERKAVSILEVGAGANPLLNLSDLPSSCRNYTLLDISAEELAKAPAGYRAVLADVAASHLQVEGSYDFVFSRMLAEHVRDGRLFHSNIFRLLAPGGMAVHFFPTLYALPFVINRIIPECITEGIVRALQPGRFTTGRHEKFPARYDWCRGPTRRQLSRLRSLGYHIDEYIGYFGHDGYYLRIPVVRAMHSFLSAFLVKHPSPHLTSFAYVVLTKPRDLEVPPLRNP
jgi:SAM-dependent methyltransferase